MRNSFKIIKSHIEPTRKVNNKNLEFYGIKLTLSGMKRVIEG